MVWSFGQIWMSHNSYATAYLDDFINYGGTWKGHLKYVTAVLQSLKEIGRMANPTKLKWPIMEKVKV